MRAITVAAAKAQSLSLTALDPPHGKPDDLPGDLLLRCLEIGTCGTDVEQAAFQRLDNDIKAVIDFTGHDG